MTCSGCHVARLKQSSGQIFFWSYKKMKHLTFKFFKLPVLAMLLFSLVTLSACQEGGLGGGDQETASDEAYFQDDFSDPASGWELVNDEGGSADYFEGTFRIQVNPNVDPAQGGRIFYWSNPKRIFGDVRTEVDVTKASGGDTNVYGVICGYQDANNFFALFISSDGYYGITKILEGAPPKFIGKAKETGKMIPSDVIQKGNTTNHIRADCVESKLTLYVNGQLLDSAEDPDLAGGDSGLLAGAFAEGGLDIRFDNLKILAP